MANIKIIIKSKKLLLLVSMSALFVILYLLLSSASKGKNVKKESDVNNNGLWDSVEEVIDKKYPNNLNFNKATKQCAKFYQIAIEGHFDIEKLMKIRGRAYACVAYVVKGDTDKYGEILDFSFDSVVNSAKRSRAYKDFNLKLSGRILDSGVKSKESCNF